MSSYRALIEVSQAISRDRNLDTLLPEILRKSCELSRAEAGTIYIAREDRVTYVRALEVRAAQNALVEAPPIRREPFPINANTIAGYVAQTLQPLNLADVYELPADVPFRFNADWDQRTGYRCKSMLVVPMRDAEGLIVGLIQLINKRVGGQISVFTAEDEELIQSFSESAGIAVENAMLLQERKKAFDDFVDMCVTAIEKRDPITAGHSKRVSRLTRALAEEVSNSSLSVFANDRYSPLELDEIAISALLHDFGKIGVPEAILSKANKLSDDQLRVIMLRIDKRLEAFRAEAYRGALESKDPLNIDQIERLLASFSGKFEGLKRLILEMNVPNVIENKFLKDFRLRLEEEFQGKRLLEPWEVEALLIPRGSLTPKEFDVIRSHAGNTKTLLSRIPWPRGLRNIPLYASCHHERLNGTGYPDRLMAEQIPFPSQIMAIADIFDALTSPDRPYKDRMAEDEALKVLWNDASRGFINEDLVSLFENERVWEAKDRLTIVPG